MSDEPTETQEHTPLRADRFNLIIATCAILISAASFYATYLQANSAKEQVKAMTWPLIEFTHGNYDPDEKVARLSLSLRNAGVGPAVVRSVVFHYDDTQHASLNDFLRDCCIEQMRSYQAAVKHHPDELDWTLTTEPVNGIILPVSGAVNFLQLVQHENNADIWRALNDARWNLQLSVCYCSLLENCYVTNGPGRVEEVRSCPSTADRP